MNLFRFGKAPEPTPMASLHPDMQAHYDPALPVWVATDHAVFGTFDRVVDAIALADRIVDSQPYGERIIVTVDGVPVYNLHGTGSIGTPASKR